MTIRVSNGLVDFGFGLIARVDDVTCVFRNGPAEHGEDMGKYRLQIEIRGSSSPIRWTLLRRKAMKKLLLMTILLCGCGQQTRNICDSANELRHRLMLDYCEQKTCCYCECIRAGSVMKCGEYTFDCATPYYQCPEDEISARVCVDYVGHCATLAEGDVMEFCH